MDKKSFNIERNERFIIIIGKKRLELQKEYYEEHIAKKEGYMTNYIMIGNKDKRSQQAKERYERDKERLKATFQR